MRRCSETSAGAGTTRLSRTWVTKSLPCSRRDSPNERGRSPAGCERARSETKVPEPRTWTRNPSSTSSLMARRTVPREMPKRAMSSCSEGMREPGAHSCSAIFSRRRFASCEYTGAEPALPATCSADLPATACWASRSVSAPFSAMLPLPRSKRADVARHSCTPLVLMWDTQRDVLGACAKTTRQRQAGRAQTEGRPRANRVEKW